MTREAIARLREEASARIESDPQGALSRFQHVLRIDPADIESWAASAELLLRLGQIEAAEDGFTRVLRLAERANSQEWASYAQRSLAHLRQSAPLPQIAEQAPEVFNAAPAQGRAAMTDTSGAHAFNRAAASEGAKPRAIAPAIAGALLTCIAGVGFLLLVTTSAASQLWAYPYVRAALLRTIDDLTAATLLGYFGSVLLQKMWSSHRIGRVLVYVAAGILLSGAMWMTLSGLLPLSSLFAECTNIEDIEPACNIQIEQLEKMTPEARKQLDVL